MGIKTAPVMRTRSHAIAVPASFAVCQAKYPILQKATLIANKLKYRLSFFFGFWKYTNMPREMLVTALITAEIMKNSILLFSKKKIPDDVGIFYHCRRELTISCDRPL